MGKSKVQKILKALKTEERSVSETREQTQAQTIKALKAKGIPHNSAVTLSEMSNSQIKDALEHPEDYRR